MSLVEVSPHLRGMQWEALRCQGPPPAALRQEVEGGSVRGSVRGSDSSDTSVGARPDSSSSSSSSSGSGVTGVSGWNGARVTWHRSLAEVVGGAGPPPAGGIGDSSSEGGSPPLPSPPPPPAPAVPALYIAHEFLDALPVHQFQRTERGWCERLVDVAAPDSPLHLRLVLSPGPTPAARVLLPRRLRQLASSGGEQSQLGTVAEEPQRQQHEAIEICPQVCSIQCDLLAAV